MERKLQNTIIQGQSYYFARSKSGPFSKKNGAKYLSKSPLRKGQDYLDKSDNSKNITRLKLPKYMGDKDFQKKSASFQNNNKLEGILQDSWLNINNTNTNNNCHVAGNGPSSIKKGLNSRVFDFTVKKIEINK